MAEGLLSGVLPAIYSGSNTFKRKLVDALRNPGATLENMAGNAYDKTMRAGQMLADATAESQKALRSGANPFKGPASDRLTQAVMENYNPAGITVWHGSPHRFTKFDASKIGTGEGAQAYGHGLYVAESPEVARGYQTATSKDRFLTKDGFFDPSQLEHLNVKAVVRRGDLDQAIAQARKYAKPDHDYPETAAKAARDLAKLEALKQSGGIRTNEGALYKIDLPDEYVAKMLDWDKPLGQQTPEVQKFVGSVFNPPALDRNIGDWLKSRMGNGMSEYWSDDMKKAGIPGIRYLDQGSRGQGKGTSNFVVFPGNEDMLKILEVNNQPIIEALRKKQ